MANKNNISKVLLNEFYNLSKSDLEIQISKNIERLIEVEQYNVPKDKTTKNVSKGNNIDNMMQGFYISLSNYFCDTKADKFTNDQSFATNFKTFKKQYIKFINNNQKQTANNQVA